MPYLKEIVQYINDGLKVSVLTDARFSDALLHGISMPVVIEAKKTTIPGIISNDGEIKYVTPDDVNALSIYHRINGKGYSLSKDSVGESDNYLVEKIDMSMFVFGLQNKLELSADQLETLLMAGFIDKIPKADWQGLQIRKNIITLTSSNFNTKAIFTNEFQGVKYFLKPEHILFEIKYTIENDFNKICFKKCDC